MAKGITCTCGHSWNKSDSSKKDMNVCHICGKDNTMEDGGWLDKYQDGGLTDKYLGVKTNSKGKYVAPTNNGWTYKDPKLAAKIKAEQARGVGDIDAEAMQALEQVTSYPQRKITELVTGTNQYPSQAMGIQNPYGAFAVDAVLDPTNIVGAGLLGKAAKASGKLSKASKIAKAVNTVGAPNKQIISSTGNFFNELADKILPREVPVQQSIDAGNQWTKDWISHPATQEKVLNDLNATYSPTNQSTRKNYINHSLNYQPNSALYPLSQQAKDLAQIIWQGKTNYGSKQMMHADNMGVSYRHRGVPLDDVSNSLLYPRYGTWISRNPRYSAKQIESTVAHENYHDWLRQDALVQTGQFHDIQNSLNPKNVDLYDQWYNSISQGKNPVDVMGKDNAYLGYLADPTEVHARIGELRKKYEITPSQMITSKDIQNMRAGENLPGNVIDKKFFDLFKNDANAARMFNRLWAAPAAVGVGAAAVANQQEYNDGGPIQPNYNDASVSMSKDFVGDGYSNVGRNYSPAWGGQFEDGGNLPNAKDGWLETLKSTLNPHNWGVSDYSNKGNFNSAYELARKAGEKEFMWNNKRYSTNMKGTPSQQLQWSGITNDRLGIQGPLEKRAYLSVRPGVYGNANEETGVTTVGHLKNFIKGYDRFDQNKTNEGYKEVEKEYQAGNLEKAKRLNDELTYYKDYSGEDDAYSEDAWQMYLGMPQKKSSFSISKYKPTKGKNQNVNYYSLPDEFKQDLLNSYISGNIKVGLNDEFALPSERSEGPHSGTSKGRVLGNFTVGKGKDEKGEYISYYDKYDLSTTLPVVGEVSVDQFVGKPFEIYDRIYLDPKTGKPKMAMGGSMPGAVGFTYARTGSIPSNGPYAKKTKASAQNGTEMKYYQEGLDFKPKTISKNGSELKKLDQLTNFTNYNPTKPSGWLEKYQ